MVFDFDQAKQNDQELSKGLSGDNSSWISWGTYSGILEIMRHISPQTLVWAFYLSEEHEMYLWTVFFGLPEIQI